MFQDPAPYLSYLLRLWLEDGWEREQASGGQAEWRASLEDPHTQEMQVFTDLDALFEFLLKETTLRGSKSEMPTFQKVGISGITSQENTP